MGRNNPLGEKGVAKINIIWYNNYVSTQTSVKLENRICVSLGGIL